MGLNRWEETRKVRDVEGKGVGKGKGKGKGERDVVVVVPSDVTLQVDGQHDEA